MSNILLTGHSGFLGSHIKTFLMGRGYNIINLGRSKDSDIICDLANETFKSINIDYVIHVAGKAHSVPKNQAQINEFYKVNHQGTKNLIKSVSKLSIKTFVFISTVAVYGRETGELIDESANLLGITPYALSKIKAEQEVIKFGKQYNINNVILRLPLVTGKGAVGNLKGIIKAIRKGYYFRIGKGDVKKSIISASDISAMIPELIHLNGVYNLTDCKHPTISEIDSIIAKKFNKKIKKIPIFLLKFIGKIGDLLPLFPFDSSKFNKLTKNLTFSNKKILQEVNYRPIRGLSDINL